MLSMSAANALARLYQCIRLGVWYESSLGEQVILLTMIYVHNPYTISIASKPKVIT